MTQPTTPIELRGHTSHFGGADIALPAGFEDRLSRICEVDSDLTATAEASRDWWPLALHWALQGKVPRRAAILVKPTKTEQVSQLLAACNEARVPVTPAAGRSGVCGASVPLHGGVLLDLTGLDQFGTIDAVSGIIEVQAGMFGPDLERCLNADHQLTVGHFPQSFELATVGGWVACRGAGQYSTRYGKIETMVVGLEVVLADGTVIRTGGAPAAAVGPDLNQVFIGSEGTLGVITRVWLRAHPLAPAQRRAAYSFPSLADAFDACRRIIRRGATPAVLRVYDAIESARGRGGDGASCTMLVLDEGDELLIDATMRIVALECDPIASQADLGLVAEWLEHRNDTSGLQALTHKGFVVDTMEIAAPWSKLLDIHAKVSEAIMAVPNASVVSCHLSHSYLDGACLYFTFAARPATSDEIEPTYIGLWDAGQRAVLDTGGNLSHHHGIGLNRARFVPEALGASHRVLIGIKQSLDPNGILNPGKLGLPDPFGGSQWP